jgi:hypothetical protein
MLIEENCDEHSSRKSLRRLAEKTRVEVSAFKFGLIPNRNFKIFVDIWQRYGECVHKIPHFWHMLRSGYILFVFGLWVCRLHCGSERARIQLTRVSCVPAARQAERFSASSQITSIYYLLDQEEIHCGGYIAYISDHLVIM